MNRGSMKRKRTSLSPAVRAANALTPQWCTRLGSGDFALSGAGLWPLLALLASAADEEAGAQLAAALSRPAESGQQDALELIEILDSGRHASRRALRGHVCGGHFRPAIRLHRGASTQPACGGGWLGQQPVRGGPVMNHNEIEVRKKKAERGWLADPAPPPPQEYIPGEENKWYLMMGARYLRELKTGAGTSGGS